MNTSDDEPLTGVAVPAHAVPERHDLSPLARAAMDAGMPPNTRRNYLRGWKEFTRWCEANGREPLPATTATLTEFTTWLCYERPVTDNYGRVVEGVLGMSPASVEQALWAVAKAHDLAEVPAPHRGGALLVLKGYRAKLSEEHDPRAKTRKATATTREEMPVLAGQGAGRNTNPLIAIRDQALLHMNWAAGTRVSELVRLNAENITILPAGLTVDIYRPKNRHRPHDTVVIPKADSPMAVAAIIEWLAVLTEHGRVPGPLFPRISRSGTIGATAYGGANRDSEAGSPDGRMTARGIEQRIAIASDLAGMDRRTAHSQRRGFATAARLAGHDPLAIGRHGGWADNSPALAGYMDEADKWGRNPLKGAGV